MVNLFKTVEREWKSKRAYLDLWLDRGLRNGADQEGSLREEAGVKRGRRRGDYAHRLNHDEVQQDVGPGVGISPARDSLRSDKVACARAGNRGTNLEKIRPSSRLHWTEGTGSHGGGPLGILFGEETFGQRGRRGGWDPHQSRVGV